MIIINNNNRNISVIQHSDGQINLLDPAVCIKLIPQERLHILLYAKFVTI